MITQRIVAAIWVSGMAIAPIGCGDDGGTGPADDSGGGDVTGSRTVTINMQNIAFVAPGGSQDVIASVGDTIRWVNLDGVPHTVTASTVPEGGAELNSGLIQQGEVFIFVPNVIGEWIYLCEVHPTIMRDARITVLE